MFVSKSRYLALQQHLTHTIQGYAALAGKWSKLVDQINELGGERFLVYGHLFTERELDVLVKLCHPDKHQGSKEANEMTSLLLEIRSRRK
jgi:hypothetical protein